MIDDYEALEPRSFLPQALGHNFCLTAEFKDLDAARRAREALRQAGLADEKVLLLGQLGDEVNTRWGLCADERIVMGAMTWRIALGGGVGALLGGLLSLAATSGIVAGEGQWAATVAGAVFGAVVGSVVGGVSGTRLVFSDAELHRHHPELDHAMLGLCNEEPATGSGRKPSCARSTRCGSTATSRRPRARPWRTPTPDADG
jgi:hypothetical protein